MDAPALESLLAAALVRDSVDAGAEQRAVAAFRAAREAGGHGARTRRRDDWRPRRRGLGSRPVKAVLSVLLGGLALGGVAVAGIGVPGPVTDRPAQDHGRTSAPPAPPRPSTGGPTGEPAGGSPGPGSASASAVPDRPAAAGDTEAHCRAYERVAGRGAALDATAWKRLTAAAGGEAKVDAYCAEQRERATAGTRPGGSPAPGKGTGGAGRAGNGSSGDARDDTPGTAGGARGDGTSGAGGSAGGPGGSGAAESGSGSRRGEPAQPGADRS
ncbi:hypothetical protein [Streptomyces viridosporus]|uniref:hypothetical protein n=1 Tax=Streptomyces viridosporus TaxID=67581 RepID=UPI0036FDFFFC